jgi:small subunit ribosomal protein S27Ae
MSTELVVLGDYDNQLMNRRELKIIFRNVSGNIKKKEAIETISKANKLDSKTIVPIEIKCNKGSTDVSGFFHIYKSEESAKEILPKYRSIRILEKAERKKIFDEAKAQKLKEKQQTSEKGKPKK